MYTHLQEIGSCISTLKKEIQEISNMIKVDMWTFWWLMPFCKQLQKMFKTNAIFLQKKKNTSWGAKAAADKIAVPPVTANWILKPSKLLLMYEDSIQLPASLSMLLEQYGRLPLQKPNLLIWRQWEYLMEELPKKKEARYLSRALLKICQFQGTTTTSCFGFQNINNWYFCFHA